MNTPRKSGMPLRFSRLCAAAGSAALSLFAAAAVAEAASAASAAALQDLLRGTDARAALAAAVAESPPAAKLPTAAATSAATGLRSSAGTLLQQLAGYRGQASQRSALRASLQSLRASSLLLALKLEQDIQPAARHPGAGTQAVQRQQHLQAWLRQLDAAVASFTSALDNLPAGAPLPAAVSAELQALLSADAPAAPIYGANLPVHRPRLPAREPAMTPAIVPSYADNRSEVEALLADYAAGAEAPLSPAILAKAQSLGNDYTRILDFVRSNVRTQWYAGAQQGAEGILRSLAGNDVDQASLLVALLRASRAPARYVRGVLEVSTEDLAASLGVRSDKVGLALAAAGVAHRPVLRGGRIAAYAIEHIYVSAKLPFSHYRGSAGDLAGATWVPLAPALKPHALQPAAGALARAGVDAQAFVDDYLLQPRSDAPLALLRATLQSRLAALTPPLSYDSQLATHAVAATPLELLPASLPAPVLAVTGEFAELPETLRQQARIVVRSGSGADAPVVLDTRIAASQLADRRVTLSYQPASIADGAIVDAYGGMDATPPYLYDVRAQLQIGGQTAALGDGALATGLPHRIDITLQSPGGEASFSQLLTAGGHAALVFDAQAGSPPGQPDGAVVPGDSEPAAARLLANLGARYLREWDQADAELAALAGVSVIRPFPAVALVINQYHVEQLAGVAQSQSWRGVALDAAFRPAEAFTHLDSNGAERDWTALSALQGSRLEHSVFEQQWRVDSISADKALQLARSRGEPVDTLSATTGTGGLNQPPEVIAAVAGWLGRGYVVDIVRNPLVEQAWSGAAWRVRSLSSGEAGYFIAGGLAGGATVLPPSLWYLQDLVALLGNPYAQTVNDDALAGAMLVLDRRSQDQLGFAGQALPETLRAIVLDATGAPVRGAEVTFRITAGNGHLGASGSSFTTVADVRGEASAVFTSGERIQPPLIFHQAEDEPNPHKLGAHRIEVSAASRNGVVLAGEPLRALSKPGPAAQIVLGDVLSPVLTGLGIRHLRADVQDASGNAIANAPLSLRVDTETESAAPRGAQEIGAALFLPGDCPAYTPLLTGHACTRNVIGGLHARADGLAFSLVPGNLELTSTYVVHAQSGSVENSLRLSSYTSHATAVWLWSEARPLPEGQTSLIEAAPLNTLLPRAQVAHIYRPQDAGTGVVNWQPDTTATLNFSQFTHGSVENIRYNDGAPGLVRFDVRAGATPGAIRGVVSTGAGGSTEPSDFGWAIDLPAPTLTPSSMPLTAFSTTTADLRVSAAIAPPEYIATPLSFELRADGAVVQECRSPYGGGLAQCSFDRGLTVDRTRQYTVVLVLNDGTPFRLQSAPTALSFDQPLIGGYGVLPGGKRHSNPPGPRTTPEELVRLVRGEYPKLVDVDQSLDMSANYSCAEGRSVAFLLNVPAVVSLAFYRQDADGRIDNDPVWQPIVDDARPAGLQDFYVTPSQLPLGEYKFVLRARAANGQEETREGVANHAAQRLDNLSLSHPFVKGVDLYSGGAVLAETDIAVGGRGPGMSLQRSYASHAGDQPGFLGRGWSAELDGQVLTNECLQRIVTGPGGQGQRFDPAGQLPDGGQLFTAQFGYHGTLVQRGADYDFYAKDGTRYHYAQPDREGPRLSFVEDTNGNRVQYSWQLDVGKPRVNRISDSSGRQIDLVYSTVRHERRAYGIDIIKLYTLLTEARGPGGLRVRYGYDDKANLVSVLREDGSGKGQRSSGYEYRDYGGIFHANPGGSARYSHFGQRLIKARDNLDGATREYDYEFAWSGMYAGDDNDILYLPEQRVRRVREPDGGGTQFSYSGLRGLEPGSTTVTDARNAPTRYDLNLAGGAEVVTDPAGITRTSWNLLHRQPEETEDALGGKTTYTYDVHGNKLTETVVTPHGNLARSWTYYDSGEFTAPFLKNRVRTATDARNITTTFTYDARGNLTGQSRGGVSSGSAYASNGDRIRQTDGEGKVWTFRYDAHGFASEAESPLRHVSATRYDILGRKLSETDANGHTTRWTYDARDRVLTTQYPLTAAGAAVERFVYDDALRAITAYDPRNNPRVSVLDSMGRVLSESIGGDERSYRYDFNGNKTGETDFGDHETTFTYDPANRLSEKLEAGLRKTVYTHDALGHVLSETSGKADGSEQRRRSYRYEHATYARTEVETEISSEAGTDIAREVTGYDENGNAVRLVDAQQRETTRSYDDRDRLASETAPLGKVTTFSYDGRDLKRSETRSNTGGSGVQTRRWNYDDDGREIATVDALNQVRSTQYDNTRNVIARSDARGNLTRYAYDARNNLVEERGPEAGQLTTYAYDLNNNRTAELWANGRALAHTYDARNRRLASSDQRGQVETRSYLPDDQVHTLTDADGRVTTRHYDTLHRLVREELPGPGARERGFSHGIHDEVLTETDPLGRITRHGYDSIGRRLSTTFPTVDGVAAVVRSRYDLVGNLVAQVNARQQETTFVYNDLNQRISQTDPQACGSGPCTQSWSYDSEGNVLSHRDRRGVLSVSAYDRENRLAGQSRAGLVLQTVQRDAQGNISEQRDALNRLTVFDYDKANRKTRQATAGAIENWTYTPLGDVLTQVDADRRSTTYAYTERRFLASESLAGETTHYEYDGSGHRTRLQRPNGEASTWVYGYDSAGRLQTVTDPLQHTTEYGYDANDNRTSVRDANDHLTTFHYDERNRLNGKTYPGGAAWTWDHDADNNRIHSESPNGRISSTDYDALNRPTVTTYAAAPASEVQTTTRSYDGNGNVLSISETDSSGTRTETRDYDDFDRLVHIIDGNSRALHYRYDDAGNRTHRLDADGQETVWTYNALNQNTHVYVPGQGTTVQTHTPAGRLETLTRPDGSTTVHSYTDAGRIAAIMHAKSGTTLAQYSYAYDANGNRLEQLETNGAASGGVTQRTAYVYDEADRLVEVEEPGRNTVYILDPAGNRTRETVKDVASITISDSALSYNDRDQLTGRSDPVAGINVVQTWDDDGNLASQTVNGGTPRTYTYDARDRLLALDIPAGQRGSTALTFAYNPDGLRRQKSDGNTTTRYQYDDQSLLAETNTLGNTLRQYHYSATQLIAETLAGTTPRQRHYLLDALRSPIALLTQDGNVSARTSYDAFGEVRAQVSTSGTLTTPDRDTANADLIKTDDQPIGFTGYIKDTESGLYYARARYYDPATARFTTEDPEAGKDLEPPSLHRYLYAYASPTYYSDPDGRQSIEINTQSCDDKGNCSSQLTSGSALPLLSPSQMATGTQADALIEAQARMRLFGGRSDSPLVGQPLIASGAGHFTPPYIQYGSTQQLSSMQNSADLDKALGFEPNYARVGRGVETAGELAFHSLPPVAVVNGVRRMATANNGWEFAGGAIEATLGALPLGMAVRAERAALRAERVANASGKTSSQSRAVVLIEGSNVTPATAPAKITAHNGSLFSVDKTMHAADEAAGVLINGRYIQNPTARNLSYMVTESGRIGSKRTNGRFMYVIDQEGAIIVGSRNASRMPHPTLVGGENPRVLGAGIVDIRGGKIYSVDNASGHFKPGPGSLDAAQSAFSQLPPNVFRKDFQGYLPYTRGGN
jgi:RHS repeat-associated protein